MVTNYIKTIGGEDKLNSLKGIKMIANYGGVEIPVDVVTLKGGKMYVKINFQGKEIKQMASDRNVAWTTNMMT
ncbi:hypothetical protein V3468_02435 [Flavobacterium oreochromis]